jgi:hypothetical protein
LKKGREKGQARKENVNSRALSIFLSPINKRAHATMTYSMRDIGIYMLKCACSKRFNMVSHLNQKLYHGIIFTCFDCIDTARFPLVALLKKNGFCPKKTGMRALLKRLRKKLRKECQIMSLEIKQSLT